MSSKNIATVAVILAAGKGTRLKSKQPKVLHDILGKPIIHRCLDTLITLSETSHKIAEVYIVVGHQADRVKEYINQQSWPFKITFVLQEPQLGTGHALQLVATHLDNKAKLNMLITCGDTPCIPASLFEQSINHHHTNKADLTIVSCQLSSPGSYGRLIFNTQNTFEKIVEAKDATIEELTSQWINTGIYIANWPILASILGQLEANNTQKEYYLTDVAELLKQDGKIITVCPINTPTSQEDILGINSRSELAQAIQIFSQRKITELCQNGVTIIQPASTLISPEVSIAPDTTIYPNTLLLGRITIGENTVIGPGTTLRGPVSIGDNCIITHSYIQHEVTIGSHNNIGPFAHIRDNTTIHNNCRIGNYVEVKQTELGSFSNAAHLSYLGDAEIGCHVNMGAGSIIANYDPILDQKHETIIEDGVKVGCNTTLIAPVILKNNACVAAGSTITKNVGESDLAIARSHQSIVPKWVKRKKELSLQK